MKGCPYVDPVTTLVASTPEVLLQGSLVALGGVHREGKGRRFSLRTAWTYFQEVTRRCFRGLRGKGSARRLCAISRSLSTATYLRTYRGMHKVTKYCVAMFFFFLYAIMCVLFAGILGMFPTSARNPSLLRHSSSVGLCYAIHRIIYCVSYGRLRPCGVGTQLRVK